MLKVITIIIDDSAFSFKDFTLVSAEREFNSFMSGFSWVKFTAGEEVVVIEIMNVSFVSWEESGDLSGVLA